MKNLLLIAVLFVLVSCRKENATYRVLDGQKTWIEGCLIKTGYHYTIYRIEDGEVIPTQAETQLKIDRIPGCEDGGEGGEDGDPQH